MHTILGINGTVGPGLAQALAGRDVPVRGVSRRPFSGNWEHKSCDVLNLPDLIAATEGSEVIYLLIGLPYNKKVWQRDWPVAMENAIEASMLHGAKLVFLDNVYAYGLVRGDMVETTPLKPCSEKGKVRKAIAERLMEAVEKRSLRAVIARAADFYGPHAANSVFNATILDRLSAGKGAFLMGRADKVHNFTYSLDMGPALALLGLDDRANNQVWHLPTSAERWTGAEWVKAAAAEFGVKPAFQATPTFLLRMLGLFNPLFREMVEMNYQFTHDYFFSSEKFEKTFGLKPVGNRKGLADSVEWYRQKAS